MSKIIENTKVKIKAPARLDFVKLAHFVTLNPVGHQSTNWTDLLFLMAAMAVFTSFNIFHYQWS
jgi:Flp pilus assembly protein protease CpaA